MGRLVENDGRSKWMENKVARIINRAVGPRTRQVVVRGLKLTGIVTAASSAKLGYDVAHGDFDEGSLQLFLTSLGGALVTFSGVSYLRRERDDPASNNADMNRHIALEFGAGALAAAAILFGTGLRNASGSKTETALPPDTAVPVQSVPAAEGPAFEGPAVTTSQSAGGYPCEIPMPFGDDSSWSLPHKVQLVQGALNSLGDPKYNVGPTDGAQPNGGLTDTAIDGWKVEHGFVDQVTGQPIQFNEAMCNIFISLTDGNLGTPELTQAVIEP